MRRSLSRSLPCLHCLGGFRGAATIFGLPIGNFLLSLEARELLSPLRERNATELRGTGTRFMGPTGAVDVLGCG